MIVSLYILLSIGLFIGTSVRAYFEYDNFFDTCQVLITDKLYLIFTINFFIAVSIFIVTSFLNHYIGEFKPTEIQQIIEKLYSFLGSLLFVLLTIRAHIGMKEFAIIPIPLLLRYSEMCLNQRITLFSISAVPPTSKQHQNIAACQVIVLFAFFYVILLFAKKFQETKNDFILMLITQLIHGFCHVLQDIVGHIVFLIDRHNNGNSQTSFRINLASQIIFQCIIFICDINFFIYMSLSSSYIFYCLKSLIDVAMKMIEKIKKYVKFQRLQKMLKDKLQDATADDLKEDSVCIICRNEMEPGKAKKLPCGHCFHIDCLERWVGQQIKCPTCQCDLTKIIDNMDTVEKDVNNAAQRPAQDDADNGNYHDFSEFVNSNEAISGINDDQNDELNIPEGSSTDEDAIRRIDMILEHMKIFHDELLQIRADIERKKNQ